MKRIEFIAPVEAMRGNLSGKQTLEYPLNNNPAYEAPVGKHYATNYQPSFIGAKRASDGLKYFAVKRRSAIRVTAKQKMNWAVTGACGAIIGSILADKTSELYAWVMQCYEGQVQSGLKKTLRAWLSENIMRDLRAKAPMISFYYLFPTPLFNNPFVSGGTDTHNVTISNEILVKFWSELANNPVVFTIDGQKGIAHNGDSFSNIIAGAYNVLGISSQEIGEEGDKSSVVVFAGGMVCVDDSGGQPTQLDPAMNAVNNAVYYTLPIPA